MPSHDHEPADGGMLKVTYVKSTIGYSQRQKDTVRSLGLKRLGESVVQPDNGAVRGMIAAVVHLVEVEPLAPAEIQVELAPARDAPDGDEGDT